MSKKTGKKPGKISDAHIYQVLYQAIHEHHLLPDTHLPEDELAKSFAVSRTRIRQVLERLVHEQLVIKQPNKGCFVASMRSEQVQEVFFARRILELSILDHIDLPVAPESCNRLQQLCEQESQHLQAGDFGRANTLSGAFHVAIAELLDNDTLTQMVKRLIARSSLAIAIYSDLSIMQCDNDCHRKLLMQLQTGDRAVLKQHMHSHLIDLEAQLLVTNAPPGTPDFTAMVKRFGGTDQGYASLF